MRANKEADAGDIGSIGPNILSKPKMELGVELTSYKIHLIVWLGTRQMIETVEGEDDRHSNHSPRGGVTTPAHLWRRPRPADSEVIRLSRWDRSRRQT